MATDAAFLQAIRDTPDDDAPRLIYADWLDDHGDADRAAFIRVQCRLASVREDDPQWAALAIEERRLEAGMLAAVRSARRTGWAKKLPAWVCKEGVGFERGFLARVETTPGKFLKGAKALCQVTPLQQVRLRQVSKLIADVAALPELRHVRALELPWSRIDGPRLERLPGARTWATWSRSTSSVSSPGRKRRVPWRGRRFTGCGGSTSPRTASARTGREPWPTRRGCRRSRSFAWTAPACP